MPLTKPSYEPVPYTRAMGREFANRLGRVIYSCHGTIDMLFMYESIILKLFFRMVHLCLSFQRPLPVCLTWGRRS